MNRQGLAMYPDDTAGATGGNKIIE